MVKAYLRYEQELSLGLVATHGPLLYAGTSNKLYTTANHDINVFNTRTQSLISKISGSSSAVTALARCGQLLAIGYENGTIRLFKNETQVVVFSGHKRGVTALAFNKDGELLASGSKEGLVVVWDIQVESGVCKLSEHQDQVTDLVWLNQHLISCSKDSLVKAWDIKIGHCFETAVLRSPCWSLAVSNETVFVGCTDNTVKVFDKNLSPVSEISRQSKERVGQLRVFDGFLFVMSSDKSLEVFKILSDDELKKKQAKKKKQGKELKDEDHFKSWLVVFASSKVKSFDYISGHLALALSNNLVQIYSLDLKKKEHKLISDFEMLGHRTEIKTSALSPDETCFLTASNDSLKIWSTATGQATRTIEVEDSLSSVFLTSDQVAIGTRKGHILILDLPSGFLLEDIKAHEGAIWSIKLSGLGLFTASADKTVKLWSVEHLLDPSYSTVTKRLSLVHQKTLQLTEDVLAVAISPNEKLIACSLLDNTVKVFYSDSFKFFLSLYGHKLPILSIDITSDNSLLISASADKNVKIWGLDFGDCHKSIFAHQESITCCKFIGNTHYFLTCSKNSVKYFDADKFVQILKFDFNGLSFSTLSVSKTGSFFLAAGSNVILMKRTQDQVFLEEEREKEIEEIIEKDLESSVPKTDVLSTALDNIKEGKLLNHASKSAYLASVLAKMELEELLYLPNAYLTLLLESICDLVKEIPVLYVQALQVVVFVLKHVRLQVEPSLLLELRQCLRETVEMQRSLVGFNLAALKILKQVYDLEHSKSF